MAIVAGEYLDDTDINQLITKVNEELKRREGLDTPSVVSPVVPESYVDDSFFNTLANRLDSLKNSHCNCQTDAAIIGRMGCPTHSYSLKTSVISPSDAGDVPVVAQEGVGVNDIPDVGDVDVDVTYLKNIKVCHNCTCNQVCTCNNVQNCLSHCLCQSHCLCNTACRCNRDCCENDCGCDDDCTCVTHVPCSCENYIPCYCNLHFECPTNCLIHSCTINL